MSPLPPPRRPSALLVKAIADHVASNFVGSMTRLNLLSSPSFLALVAGGACASPNPERWGSDSAWDLHP